MKLTQVKEASGILRAIKHDFRQKIISHLIEKGPVTVTDLQKTFFTSQTVMSQHLAILRSAGVVICTRNKKFIKYEANKQRIDNIINLCKQIINE